MARGRGCAPRTAALAARAAAVRAAALVALAAALAAGARVDPDAARAGAPRVVARVEPDAARAGAAGALGGARGDAARAYDGERWDCVFLHGAGEAVDAPDTPTNDEYWGPKLLAAMPQCATATFNHADTTNHGWADDALLESYCRTALLPPVSERNRTGAGAFGRGDTVVRNKLLFTHSMANNILSEAIRRGTCSLDKDTTAWYMIQGPMVGSQAADMIKNICSNMHFFSRPVRWIASELSYCRDTNISASYWSLRPEYARFGPELLEVPKEYADGCMCGTSPYGETTRYSVALEAVASLVEYGEYNDGLVGISSCMSWWGNTSQKYNDPTQNFYVDALNHADGTGRNGNGWDGSPAPVEWYSHRMGKPGAGVVRPARSAEQ